MRALQIEVVADETGIENFTNLVETKCFDDETRHEYINARITLYVALILAYCARVHSDGETGNEEKYAIHIADVYNKRSWEPRKVVKRMELEYWREHCHQFLQ